MAYITHIHVENCRNVKSLDVDLSVPAADSADESVPESAKREKPAFRHLILTGPNGSGKSGVLKSLGTYLGTQFEPTLQDVFKDPASARAKSRLLKVLSTIDGDEENLGHIRVQWSGAPEKMLRQLFESGRFFSAYIPAKRDFVQEKVPGPAAMQLDATEVGPTKSLGNRLLQFLVNKQTERLYAIADRDHAAAEQIEHWFESLWSKIRIFLEDEKLIVRFDRPGFTFRFAKADGYEFDFNMLPDGPAAAFALIAEILLRIEAAQRIKKDYTFDPEGIIVVDEIETHLHLSLQEQILPLLTTMFPKVQFIVATHSPAVIASIPDAVVYDLRKQKQFLSSDYQGIPYGVLMTEHFGISSDIDLDSTGKLIRFRALAQQPTRTPDEEREMDDLAAILTARSQILATEVWMVKERLGLSSVQLAGE